MKNTRLVYFSGFIAVTLLLLTSVYLQVYKGLVPCPLCTLQRLLFGLLGILCLGGLLLYSKRLCLTFINFLSALAALTGILLAGRQIWLQHFFTGESSECGVSLQYMMQVLSINQVLQKTFQGSVECTQRGWEFLSLDLAEWALIWFVVFLIMSIYLMVKKR